MGLTAAAHFSLDYVVQGPRDLRQIVDTPRLYHIYGRVSDWPDLRADRTEVTVTVDSLESAGNTRSIVRDIDGAILLKISDTTTSLQRGDRVAFTGRIYPIESRERPAGFDYGRYLNLRGIGAMVYLPTVLNLQIDRRSSLGFVPLVDRLRASITESLERNLSPVAAALAGGFLIGETRNIPPEIYTMFRDSGTLHLLAVSGSNVALVILFIAWLLRPTGLRPNARSLVLLAVILVFAGLSYGDPSVIRASIMAGLVIFVRMLHRPYNLNNTIALTALIILLVEPGQLFNVGFQLSFVTAWGLIFIVPKITRLFARSEDKWWYRFLVFPAVICLVAQLCSAPVVAYHFGRLPIIGVAANLVIVPMVSVGVVAVLVLLVADLVLPLLGALVGSVVDAWLRAVIVALTWFGGDHMPRLTVASLTGSDPAVVGVLMLYAVIVSAALAFHSRAARRVTVVLSLLILNAGLLTVATGLGRHSGTSVEFHSVPGGVAGLISGATPQGHDLILTGLSRRAYDLDERVLEPLLQSRGVDSLRYLVALEADFAVLDDLARLAQTWRVKAVYLSHHLEASWLDAVSPEASAQAEMPVRFFGGRIPDDELIEGLRLVEGAVIVRAGERKIVFVDRLKTGRLEPATTGIRRTLVIGDTWSPAPADWIRLREAGFGTIVCSRFEQTGPGWPDDELNPDLIPPEFVKDLSHLGTWRLRLTR
jgi:competence protein ComEC